MLPEQTRLVPHNLHGCIWYVRAHRSEACFKCMVLGTLCLTLSSRHALARFNVLNTITNLYSWLHQLHLQWRPESTYDGYLLTLSALGNQTSVDHYRPPKVAPASCHTTSDHSSFGILTSVYPPFKQTCWLAFMDKQRSMGELPSRCRLLGGDIVRRCCDSVGWTGRSCCGLDTWHVLQALFSTIINRLHGEQKSRTQTGDFRRIDEASEESG